LAARSRDGWYGRFVAQQRAAGLRYCALGVTILPSLRVHNGCWERPQICNSRIALRGIFMDNLQAAMDAPTALNVTVQATRRSHRCIQARRSAGKAPGAPQNNWVPSRPIETIPSYAQWVLSLPPAPVTDELWPAAATSIQNNSGLTQGLAPARRQADREVE
jgi:hypothetical protein